MFRKQFCVALAGAVALSLGFAGAASAQQYPDKPIKLIVPYPPGATNDLLARVLAEPLAKELGQPVIVDNKGGAATAIGATATANAPADRLQMLLGTGTTYTLNPLLKKGLAYDTDRDFKMVSIIAEVPVVFIVNPKFPAKTLSEFVAYAKANPGKVNFLVLRPRLLAASRGRVVRPARGIKITHVPYPGSAGAMRRLPGGRGADVLRGRLRRCRTSPRRPSCRWPSPAPSASPSSRSIPTVAESGYPGFEALGWYALAVPKATLGCRGHAHRDRDQQDPGVGRPAGARAAGHRDPGPQEPGSADKYMAKDRALWEPLVRSLNITLD